MPKQTGEQLLIIRQLVLPTSGIGGTHRPGGIINADHISRLMTKKFGDGSESLYAPAYVENVALRDTLLQNRTIRETLDRARKADIASGWYWQYE